MNKDKKTVCYDKLMNKKIKMIKKNGKLYAKISGKTKERIIYYVVKLDLSVLLGFMDLFFEVSANA